MTDALPQLKALADSSRLRLLRVLELGAFNVGELCGILEQGQSRVSRHLKILADAGLVRSRRQGSWVYYSLPAASEAGAAPSRPDLATGLLATLAACTPAPADDRQRALEVVDLRERRTRQFFDTVAPRWSELRDELLGATDYLPTFEAGVPDEAVLLDLGTGTGELLFDLAPRLARGIGVDRSAAMLAEAERRKSERGLANVEFRLGTLEHLPLRDAEASAATAHMVLHYVEDPARVLREVHRTLEPGGTVHLADLASHDRDWMRDKLNHRWLGFEPETLGGWLKAAGFQRVKTRTLERPGGAPDVVLASGRKAA